MGIAGLLPALKSIQTNIHVRELAGCTVAVDAYVWLHQGAFGCATELCLKKPTDKLVKYCMNMVNMLRHHNIKLIVVFDGGPLPSKQGTEQDRLARRQSNLNLAMRYHRQGDHKQAWGYFQKCVDITPEVALQFIQALRRASIPFVVAPYEADAQLCYLERTGQVDAIITEDSDLLAFGCKRVIFKLKRSGEAVEIRRANFHRVTKFSLVNWTDELFRHWCILAGCDYLPSIPRVALITAYQCLKKHRNVYRAIQDIRLQGKYNVPTDYEINFKRADFTFLYQRVYDPREKVMTTLHPLPEQLEMASEDGSLAFIGALLAPEVARGVAQGYLNPITLEAFADSIPATVPLVSTLAVNPLTPKTFGTQSKTAISSRATKSDPQKRITTFFVPPSPLTSTVVRKDSSVPPLSRGSPTASSPITPLTSGLLPSTGALDTPTSGTVRSVGRPLVMTGTKSGYFTPSESTTTLYDSQVSSTCPSLTYSQDTLTSQDTLSSEISLVAGLSGDSDKFLPLLTLGDNSRKLTSGKNTTSATKFTCSMQKLAGDLPPYALASARGVKRKVDVNGTATRANLTRPSNPPTYAIDGIQILDSGASAWKEISSPQKKATG
ncbi:Rad2 nuclease [Dispira simplex]|nr:Rad2 nuclease [Dispira simplex]